MSLQKLSFNGFFSYAHFDMSVDPAIFEMFHHVLEARVSARITNASFSLWRDLEKLKLGDRWNQEIEKAIDKSHLMIIMLSPKWLESNFCTGEWRQFHEKVERLSGKDALTILILIRNIDSQITYLSDEQREVFRELSERQYLKIDVPEFMRAPRVERVKVVDKIADDIEGIIERWRLAPTPSEGRETLGVTNNSKKRMEFDHRAHDFSKVDPISEAEIIVDSTDGEKERGVYAYIDCIPRMYVQTQSIRVEFSIRRAFLSLNDGGADSLHKIESLRKARGQANYAYYIQEKRNDAAITVCIDPKPGDICLHEVPLPPDAGENRFSKIAIISPNSHANNITAKITLRLNSEGLFIFSANSDQKISAATVGKLRAIMDVAAERDMLVDKDSIERVVSVRERAK